MSRSTTKRTRANSANYSPLEPVRILGRFQAAAGRVATIDSTVWGRRFARRHARLAGRTSLAFRHGRRHGRPLQPAACVFGNLAEVAFAQCFQTTAGDRKLTALTDLNLSSNQRTTLSPVIGQLTSLTTLSLHDNSGLGLPVEVLGPTWQEVLTTSAKPKPPSEILASYFRIVGEAGEALGECKLIVVGRGAVGKTSLIKRLSGQRYDLAEAETHGITIQNLDFDGQRGHVTGRVWDFGGQVVLHSMHEFFLTARSLYLLVLGERDDMLERDAAYWLQLIRSYAGDAPVNATSRI